MGVNWAGLGEVAIVSLAAGVVIVLLVSLSLVGFAARAHTELPSPEDGTKPPMSAGAGTTLAAVCLVAVTAIVLFGLAIILKIV